MAAPIINKQFIPEIGREVNIAPIVDTILRLIEMLDCDNQEQLIEFDYMNIHFEVGITKEYENTFLNHLWASSGEVSVIQSLENILCGSLSQSLTDLSYLDRQMISQCRDIESENNYELLHQYSYL